MADDLLAAAAAVASSPPLPPQPDTALSNASSPLTEVEDKDGDPDEMELDGPAHKSSPLSNVNIADLEDEDEDERSDEEQHSRNRSSTTRNGTRATRSQQRAKTADAHSDNDDESALSEVEPDVNDSEAETERLYDTPTKNKNIKNGAADVESSPESFTTSPTKRLASQSAAARDRTFQASPSKLKQQLRADEEGEDEEDEDDDALGDDDDDENNEADGEEEAAADDRENTRSSRRRSLAASKDIKDKDIKSATPGKTDDKDDAGKEDGPLARGQRASSDTRKRKRSPTTDPSESDQPLRKRVGSGTGPTGTGAATDTKDAAKPEDAAAADRKDGDDNSAEGTASDTFRARRSKRGNAKRRGNNSDDEGDGNDEDDDRDGAVDDDAAANGEDEPEGDIDEEAEAAHRNEEELERKKAALDNLSAIEKQFASFRDKLYQERLDQLNHEEEMLQGDNPTHPEYLAMMQCLDERRDETRRVADTELAYNMQTLNRWAVARRSHIHGQYFQSIRESREMVLEELGRQWYQIQLQRRRHANTIPDYGLRFPTSKQQRIKDAVSYNTEVSILSGLAKFEGFPAAPTIKGASHHQVDDDLEAIARGRQSEPRVQQTPSQTHAQVQTHYAQGQSHHPNHGHQGNGAPFPEGVHANGVNGNGVGAHPAHSGAPPASTHAPVSYHSLGAAGQQFLANTPWANPHHPSHQHPHPHQNPHPHSQHSQHSQHSKTAASQQMHPPSMSSTQSPQVPRDEHLIQRQQAQAQAQAPSGPANTSTSTTNTKTTGTAQPRPRARKPLPQGGSRSKAGNAKAAAAAANRNQPPADDPRQPTVPIKHEAIAEVTA